MPQTLLDWLIATYPQAKRQTFKRMLEAGRISIDGRRPRSLKQELTETSRVTVADRGDDAPAFTLPFPVIYEDRDVLAIDKPSGLLTSTVPGEPRPTALADIERYVMSREPSARVGLIHRLDRDASGLLVFSKNDEAYRALKTQFFEHSVHRVYTAIVHGRPNPPEGRIESHLIERADGDVRSTRQHGKGQHAVTDYQTLGANGTHALLRVTLQTGRKHQIRSHLATKGTPLVNDSIYGDRPPTGRLMLAATELALDHPRTGRRVTWQIDLPEEMARLLQTLKFKPAT